MPRDLGALGAPRRPEDASATRWREVVRMATDGRQRAERRVESLRAWVEGTR